MSSSNTTSVNVESGSVYVIKAGQGAVLVTGNYQLQADEVLLVSPGAHATVSGQGKTFEVHDTQSMTSIVPNARGPIATTLDPHVQIDPNNAHLANYSESDIADIQRSVMSGQDPAQDILNPGYSPEELNHQAQDLAQNDAAQAQADPQGEALPDDIAAIQQAILAGEDPTQIAEAPAAGGTANGSFITVDYDYDATLTEAGFMTHGFDREYEREERHNADVITIAEGGNDVNMVVTEGDLNKTTDSGYPTSSSSSALIDHGTYALDPESFYIPQESVDQLLSELNSEITSGGEPVQFTYDPVNNVFVGMQDGEVVMSIDVDFTAVPSGDLQVTVTTTLNGPIDHIDDNNTGMITDNGNDDLHITFPIMGADVGGNEILNPVNVGVDVIDGVVQEFGTDPGTHLNETDDLHAVVAGEVPLDIGSDEIATLVFQQDQPDLAAITSNGNPTTYKIDGNTATVTDSNGEVIMTVIIQTDGTYTVQLDGPVDQDADDILSLDLPVTATDDDGDTADGVAHIDIVDGEVSAGGSDSVTVTEGDLESSEDAHGNPYGSSYPVHGESSVTIESPSDNLVAGSLRMTEEGKAQLQSELSEMTTNDGEQVEFTVTEVNGVITITGVDQDGDPVLDITMTPTMLPNGDVTIVTEVNQQQPLDDNNGQGYGDDNSGLIINNGDQISVQLPLEIDDTDGDTSPVDITVNFVDGQDPSFGAETDGGVTFKEDDGSNTVHGYIQFDNGSDHVDQIEFSPNQPSLANLTSNGQSTHIDTEALAADPTTIVLVDSDNNPVLTVHIDPQGNYTVTQDQPIDQKSADDMTHIALNVSGTDDDGDTANGTIHINIADGAVSEGGSDEVTV
ncbi:MAG: retention module-containing protein, partial [Vibrio sp.]